MTLTLPELFSISQTRTEKTVANYLKEDHYQAPILAKAMAYSILNGGKRIRPLLVYTIGQILHADLSLLDAPAAAIELIHAYSLVHDDLPAMDNANLRRGKPSCHKTFGEGIATLAGDALQTLAFRILSTHKCALDANQRLDMIATLAQASGINGMAGGQALDLTLENPSETTILQMYQLKTGALLEASVKLGLLATSSIEMPFKLALETYAKKMGLAFQLQDDLLDIEASPETTGKPHHLDTQNQKKTYPYITSIPATKQKLMQLHGEAKSALNILGPTKNVLIELTDFLLERQY